MDTTRPARTEIWVRKLYAPYVVDGTLTTIFRPERRLRSEGHSKFLEVGEEVRVRVVDKVGADWAGVYGILLPEPNLAAVVTSVRPRRFGTFTRDDFQGSPPGVRNNPGLMMDLGLIYNLSRDEFCSRLWVTRTTFRYVSSPATHVMQ